MSDSFADLWNSSAPSTSKPAEPPRKLGAYTTGPTLSSNKPTSDVFSLLASASSTSSSRSITPSHLNVTQVAQASKVSQAAYNVKSVQKSTGSLGADAFSELLSGSLASTSTNNSNMTIAERAALTQKQKNVQLQQEYTVLKQNESAWAGLDALAASSTLSKAHADEDWDFDFAHDQPKPTPTPSVATRTVIHDDDRLGEFSSPKPSKSSTKPSTSSLFDDLDELSTAPSRPSLKVTPEQRERSNTPGDFDFGDRGDGLLDGRSDDEDDILGDLSKPVEQVRQRVETPSQPPPKSDSTSRAPSPPPHILGRIVEMGFSIEQARVALASTDTGLNVEQALETLLASGAADTDRPSLSQEPSPPRSREPGRRPIDESRRRAPAPSRPSARETPSPSVAEAQKNLQEHADKLLAQASEIGLNMFSRANAFWKEGKEKVQKVYEERAAKASSASGSGSSSRDGVQRNGRPKWMQEVGAGSDEELEAAWRAHKEKTGFRDEDDVLPPKPEPQERRRKPQAREPEPQPSTSMTANLLSDDTPSVYVSPWRRKTPSRGQTPSALTPAAQAQAPIPRAPSPVQLAQRKTVSASSSALTTSAKQKAAGTEAFKLGQYADAEKAYSQAIGALPDSHLLLIPLYNNRALTRIKTGDHNGAIEDCTMAISIIGTPYHPAREAKLTKEEDGADVDIGDAYVKAHRRRAEAYEGKEKWELAKADWEVIAGADWAKANLRGEAVRGVGRCRRMLNVHPDGPLSAVPPTSKPKTRPRPAPPAVVERSEALDRVREASRAAEAEDEEKHQLKDQVDAKLIAWKGGKENNLRALIASLENVLWPELGWQKVGMHELVTPNQVKIRYTKAIAKLHPDKLNVRNTTLEQRMIANGVFGSLNEAWNAFKP